MTTSFLPDQLRPVVPSSPPIRYGSNVRHRNPPADADYADASGKVNTVGPGQPGQRQIGVSWDIRGKMQPERTYEEGELENVD